MSQTKLLQIWYCHVHASRGHRSSHWLFPWLHPRGNFHEQIRKRPLQLLHQFYSSHSRTGSATWTISFAYRMEQHMHWRQLLLVINNMFLCITFTVEYGILEETLTSWILSSRYRHSFGIFRKDSWADIVTHSSSFCPFIHKDAPFHDLQYHSRHRSSEKKCSSSDDIWLVQTRSHQPECQ